MTATLIKAPSLLSPDRPGAVAASSSASRLRVVCIGDSTDAHSLHDSLYVYVAVGGSYGFPNKIIGEEQAGASAWLTHAALRSNGRLLNVHNAGVDSDTTAGCLARFASDVIAYRPDAVVISGGARNDIGNSVASATTRGNIVAMIRLAQANNIIPVLRTLLPDNTLYAGIRAHNAWIKTLAAGQDRNYPDIRSLLVVDPYAALVDPTSATGQWVSSYTSDGVHPSTAGSIVAADKIIADLAGLLRGNTGVQYAPFAATDEGGSPNLLLNPLMQNGSTSATSWSLTGTGTTASLVTDASVIGKAQQLVVASSTVNFHQDVTINGTNMAVGQRVKWSGLFKATATAGSLAWSLQLLYPGVGTYMVSPMPTINTDYPWSYFECESVIPTGATFVRPIAISTSGTGTIWLAQQSLINMSTL